MQKTPAATQEPDARTTTGAMRLGNALFADLTEKELAVLRELVSGDSNRTMAGRMNLSVDTIKYHLKNLLNKTGCKTRTELAVKACRCGIMPPEDEARTP